MPNLLADFFLTFSDLSVILAIVLLGFVFVSRSIFIKLACLAAFDIVVNVALKGTFKVPLSPTLHKIGYAFPSGHMQLSTVFYVWLLMQRPLKSLHLLIAILLMGIAAGLIHYDYHNGYDVLGGFVGGLLLISLYRFTLLKFPEQWPWIIGGTASLLMLYNDWIYQPIPSYAWVSYLTLWGFIGVYWLNRFYTPDTP